MMVVMTLSHTISFFIDMHDFFYRNIDVYVVLILNFCFLQPLMCVLNFIVSISSKPVKNNSIL